VPCGAGAPGNTHFFCPPDNGGQRHEDLRLLFQRLLQIAVVVERDRIVWLADDLGLLLELPHNAGFRLRSNRPGRHGSWRLQRELTGVRSIRLQEGEKLTPSNLQEGQGMLHANCPCKISFKHRCHFRHRIPSAKMSSHFVLPALWGNRPN